MTPPIHTSTPTSPLIPDQSRLDSKGIEQVWVPAGSFLMGTDEATILELKALNPPGFVSKVSYPQRSADPPFCVDIDHSSGQAIRLILKGAFG
jgi:hypothetical protein